VFEVLFAGRVFDVEVDGDEIAVFVLENILGLYFPRAFVLLAGLW
jgi:predicted nucleotidyltransferase